MQNHTSYYLDAQHIHYKSHLKKELERLQEQQIMVPLGVDETAEWCKSLVIIPRPNDTVCL